MDAIKNLTADMIKEDAPKVQIGSTVRVHVKIREGERERIQVFEGTVIYTFSFQTILKSQIN